MMLQGVYNPRSQQPTPMVQALSKFGMMTLGTTFLATTLQQVPLTMLRITTRSLQNLTSKVVISCIVLRILMRLHVIVWGFSAEDEHRATFDGSGCAGA